MKFKWLMTLTILVLLLNSGTAVAGGDHQTALLAPALDIASTRTVRIATTEPNTIDPALTTNEPALATNFMIINQLFSGLTRIDPVTHASIPDLAASWLMSPGATQFTFTLRNGLTWSDGSSLTAYDVKYGILRSLDPSTGASWAYPLDVIQNAFDYRIGSITDPNLVGINVLNNTQIQFTLETPASYFPAILSLPIAYPMPAAAIATWGATWTEPGHIVTSGPYRLTEWVHNDHILLEKFTSFYDVSNVQIDQVSVKLTDEMTAWNLFLSGELDTVSVPESVLGAVRTDPTLSLLLHTTNLPCTYYYGFSISEPPFDNLLVRKAFSAAIDRQGVIDSAVGGVQQPALTFTSPNTFGHVNGVSEGIGIPYNPMQAQQWLSDAGYPNGVGLPPITLWFNTSTGHQSIAEYIQQNWTTNLNVTVSLQSMSWENYSTEINNGDFQIWRLGWCQDFNDAYNFLYDGLVPGSNRHGGWSNATYQNYLSQAAQSGDAATRQFYYKQAEEILVETDAVMIPIYYYARPVVTQPYLQRPYNSVDSELYIRDWQFNEPNEIIEMLVENIEGLVESGVLNNGQGTSLEVKLEKALGLLDKDKPKAACNMLNAFSNQVYSLVEEGVLSMEEGQSLLDGVDEISDQVCQ